MRKKSITKYVLIVLMVLFGLQSISHLFWKMAQNREGAERNLYLKWSARLMPLDSDSILEYGAAMLAGSVRSLDQQLIERSIACLKGVINRNMLQYYAHQYLGQALFYQGYPQSPHFEEALVAFKRAVFLRGQDPLVSLDTLRLLLSLWPLLEENDRQFTRDLFRKTVPAIQPPDARSLLELWSLYAKDMALLKFGLKDRPRYFKEAAEALTAREISMKDRQVLLAHYEAYWLGYSRERYRYILNQRLDREKELKSLLRRLEDRIKGYHRMAADVQFDQTAYRTLRRHLYLEVMEFLMGSHGVPKEQESREELKGLIVDYSRSLPLKDELHALYRLLEKGGIFDSRDLWSRHLQFFIYFKMEDYDRLIKEIEALCSTLPFIRREQVDDYVSISLLLADAYIKGNRFDEAVEVLREVEKLVSERQDIYWRFMQLEKQNSAGDLPAERMAKYDQIRDSRLVELTSSHLKKRVYLADSREIEIRIGDSFLERFRDKHVLQVFTDGLITREYYLSHLQGGTIKVKLEGKNAFREVLLEIKII